MLIDNELRYILLTSSSPSDPVIISGEREFCGEHDFTVGHHASRLLVQRQR